MKGRKLSHGNIKRRPEKKSTEKKKRPVAYSSC